MPLERSRKYRILLVGDYSNLHSLLGRTLRAMGHSVTVMSAGSGFQDTQRDIDVSRGTGKASGALLYARCRWPLHKYMRGNDIVAIQNTHFLQLKPSRLRYFFDRLRGENGRVFLSAAGTDEFYVREALDPHSPLRYNEYRVGDRPAPYALEHPEWLATWQRPELVSLAEHIYQNLDGAVTALYEYDLAVRRGLPPEKVHYGGIPVDTASLPFRPYTDDGGPVRIFLGRHRGRLAEKGTGLLETAARHVADRHPQSVSLEIVENLPLAEYLKIMAGSHLLLDQIYSYSPATNALMAMARGINVVSGGEPDFYNFIGERENRPIFNARRTVEELTELIDNAATNRAELERRSRQCHDFVLRHNDAPTVAARYLRAWTQCL